MSTANDGAQKGFRKTKEPTKGQIKDQYLKHIEDLANKMQFVTQQLFASLQNQRHHSDEIGALANLLRTEPTTEAAKKGDKVLLDFFGRLKNEDGTLGKSFNGARGLGYVLELGENKLIPGFEDQIVGLATGETKTVEVTFPEEYGVEELQGKEASFSVKVIKVYRSIEGDDWISSIEEDYIKEQQALEAEAAETTEEETPAVSEVVEETVEEVTEEVVAETSEETSE